MLNTKQYGPWALVAGASEGIGLSFAKQIGQAGINVVLVARRPETLEDAAREVRAETGAQVRTLQIELSRPDVVDRMLEVTRDIEIGLLVFNAAAANFKPFIDQSEEEVLAAIRLSCISQSMIVQHFARKMTERKRGGIILVGSLAGNAGIPNMAAYGGAKAYTQLFGEALWAELKPRGIDVFVLVVGSTDTPRRRRSGASNVPGIPVLTPEEVARHALDNIADGPVQVPPPLRQMFERVCTAQRRQAVEMPKAAVPSSDKIF
jgi:short-subunit dehydrogenase